MLIIDLLLESGFLKHCSAIILMLYVIYVLVLVAVFLLFCRQTFLEHIISVVTDL